MNHVPFSAHPRERGDPVLSSVTPAFPDMRTAPFSNEPSPKELGPRVRGDEREGGEAAHHRPSVQRGLQPRDPAV
ncbi:hypothetical protein B7486_72635, partial [cyanobacterium TDX16]